MRCRQHQHRSRQRSMHRRPSPGDSQSAAGTPSYAHQGHCPPGASHPLRLPGKHATCKRRRTLQRSGRCNHTLCREPLRHPRGGGKGTASGWTCAPTASPLSTCPSTGGAVLRMRAGCAAQACLKPCCPVLPEGGSPFGPAQHLDWVLDDHPQLVQLAPAVLQAGRVPLCQARPAPGEATDRSIQATNQYIHRSIDQSLGSYGGLVPPRPVDTPPTACTRV